MVQESLSQYNRFKI